MTPRLYNRPYFIFSIRLDSGAHSLYTPHLRLPSPPYRFPISLLQDISQSPFFLCEKNFSPCGKMPGPLFYQFRRSSSAKPICSLPSLLSILLPFSGALPLLFSPSPSKDGHNARAALWPNGLCAQHTGNMAYMCILRQPAELDLFFSSAPRSLL